MARGEPQTGKLNRSQQILLTMTALLHCSTTTTTTATTARALQSQQDPQKELQRSGFKEFLNNTAATKNSKNICHGNISKNNCYNVAAY